MAVGAGFLSPLLTQSICWSFCLNSGSMSLFCRAATKTFAEGWVERRAGWCTWKARGLLALPFHEPSSSSWPFGSFPNLVFVSLHGSTVVWGRWVTPVNPTFNHFPVPGFWELLTKTPKPSTLPSLPVTRPHPPSCPGATKLSEKKKPVTLGTARISVPQHPLQCHPYRTGSSLHSGPEGDLGTETGSYWPRVCSEGRPRDQSVLPAQHWLCKDRPARAFVCLFVEVWGLRTGLCSPTPSAFPNKPITLSLWLLAVLLSVSVNCYEVLSELPCLHFPNSFLFEG